VTRRDRPPSVGRYLRSSLRLPLATLLLIAFFLYEDLGYVRDDAVIHPLEEVLTSGRVVRDDDDVLAVRYRHPVTAQVVTAHLHPLAVPAPEVGESVRVVAERADPLLVTLENDRPTLTYNLLVYVALALAGVLPLVLRHVNVWRVERLVAAAQPTFSMLGALSRPRFRRRRAELHLYALDAAVGALPVCTVPVLTTGQAPFGATFPVEVKGTPRPLGRVVARAGTAVLWPAGQARIRGSFGRPRRGPVSVGPLRATVGPPSPWPSAGARLGVLALPSVAALAAATLFAVVSATTMANAREARRLERSTVPAVGEVVDHESDDTVVVLRYGSEPGRVARAPADFASWYPKGVRFPIQVDPEDPTKARLAAEPYDATEPIAWAAIPLGVAVPLVAGRWRSWRRNAATAEAGPWWEASAQVLGYGEVTTTLGIKNSDGGLVCTARGLEYRGDEELIVVVAGQAEPGAPVALWERTGAPITVAAPAEAPQVSGEYPPGKDVLGATPGLAGPRDHKNLFPTSETPEEHREPEKCDVDIGWPMAETVSEPACPSCGGPMEVGYLEGYYLAWFRTRSKWRGTLRCAFGGLTIRPQDRLGEGLWPAHAPGRRCGACGTTVLGPTDPHLERRKTLT
jgi:hypothetical protein